MIHSILTLDLDGNFAEEGDIFPNSSEFFHPDFAFSSFFFELVKTHFAASSVLHGLDFELVLLSAAPNTHRLLLIMH